MVVTDGHLIMHLFILESKVHCLIKDDMLWPGRRDSSVYREMNTFATHTFSGLNENCIVANH